MEIRAGPRGSALRLLPCFERLRMGAFVFWGGWCLGVAPQGGGTPVEPWVCHGLSGSAVRLQEITIKYTQRKWGPQMPAPTINQRVQEQHLALRKAGLRPVLIWIPDTRRPGFDEEYRRQSRLIADAEKDDSGLRAFTDAAADDFLAGLDEWKA